METTAPPPIPAIRRLTTADVADALKSGIRDFAKAPGFGLFFGAIFSVIGIVIYLQMVVWGASFEVLPFAVGFPLVGPFMAVGLYEVSRRLEKGEPLDWAAVLTVVARQRSGQIPMMMFVCIFFFLVWVYLAHLIFALSFGLKPLTNVMSSAEILFTQEGIIMLVVGTAVGGVLAFLLFAITVISLPLLLERDLDVVTAMIVSFQSVLQNKGPMLLWGLIVAVCTMVAMIPFFLGIVVVFPVLGHASWRLYRNAIEPAAG
jgi:uncharacterized membrane protein